MSVLDASAVLALIHSEPGHEIVAAQLNGSVLGAANLAEIVGKLVDAGVDVRRSVSCSVLPGSASSRSRPPTPSSPGRYAGWSGVSRFRWAIDAAWP